MRQARCQGHEQKEFGVLIHETLLADGANSKRATEHPIRINTAKSAQSPAQTKTVVSDQSFKTIRIPSRPQMLRAQPPAIIKRQGHLDQIILALQAGQSMGFRAVVFQQNQMLRSDPKATFKATFPAKLCIA